MQITPFLFEGEALVRVIHIDGEPWFVGKDVAERLGYADPTNAMKQHCKGVVKRHPLSTSGGMQEVRILSEADVLRLIVSSKLPAAVRFERWIFEEVLPSIRKTGEYKTAAKAEDDKEKEILAMLRKVRTVSETRRAFGVPAAQQIWFELGLPVVPAMLEGDRQSDLFTRRTKGDA